MLNPPTDRIFQTAMSVIILDVYLESFSGALLPLHGCWLNITHILSIYNSLGSGFAYVCFALLTCTFILTKKSIIRSTTTAIEVLLTFIRFTMTYKNQMVFGDGIRGHISHMQTSTRLLYVFYRDGTLLFIP